MKVVAIIFSSLMFASFLTGCESEDERRLKEVNKIMQEDAAKTRARLQEGRDALRSSSTDKQQ